MAAPVIAASTRPQASAGFRAVAGVIVLAIAVIVSLIGLWVWSPWTTAATTLSAVDVAGHYGPDYPLHGGLAGPSRIPLFEQSSPYGPGYPLHGGLAGPSQAAGPLSAVDVQDHYGAGYPLHGGLAGPTRVGEGD